MFKGGFTLIELLVVISIIGLLSSVVLASLNSAREAARDTQRDSDMYQVKQALERYWLDNQQYPASTLCTGESVPNTSWCNSVENLLNGHWIANGALSPYLPSDPTDPTDNGIATWTPTNGTTYFYYSAGTTNGSPSGQYYILMRGYESKTEPTDFRFCNGNTYNSLATGKSICN